MNMKKGILILLFGIFIILAIILMSRTVSAANCGGAIQCNCGDTLNESQTMWYDLNNCSGNGITIGANNITLDCGGYLIDGDDTGTDYGIYLNNQNGVSIKNCNVREFYSGIYLSSSSNNILSNIDANSNSNGIHLLSSSNNNLINNIANSNDNSGILLYSSSNNLLINNIANNNLAGINLYENSSNNFLTNSNFNYNSNTGIGLFHSFSNYIADNTINYNGVYGINLGSSSNNRISNNEIKENSKYDIYFYVYNIYFGNTLDFYCNNIIENNTGSGNRLIKYFNDSVVLENEVLSELILCDANYSIINNITIMGSETLNNSGIIVFRTDHSNFSNINSSHNYYGIYLFQGSDDSLSNSALNHNTIGINLHKSSNVFLKKNVANNNLVGIYLQNSSYNTISSNFANNNNHSGIYLYGSLFPIKQITSYNTINGNYFNENIKYGAYLQFSGFNTFWNNSFIDNGANAFSSPLHIINNWNFSNIGNYWGDFENNIGYLDNYTINSMNIDYHPIWELAGNITIPLNKSWNLISIPLNLSNSSIGYVFRSIMDKIIVINGFESGPGGGAKTYDPLLPEFSDLHEIDYKHGYWVKMNESVNLTITGTTPKNKTINLATNWNLISYLCDTNKSVEEVFGSIMNKVIVINGFESGPGGGARTYDPKLPDFSDLQIMKPNFGYWVKMNQSAVLNYNSVC